MNSNEFYNCVKQTTSQYVSKNNKDVRIVYSILKKQTNNRIMWYLYNGIKIKFQEKQEDGTIATIKDYKITYNSNKAGNQLYFFDNMRRKLDIKIQQLVNTGDLKLKDNHT